MDITNTYIYEFGNFRLEEKERRLIKNEEVIPLQPKSFDVLLILIQNAGQRVARETLNQAIWKDISVEDNNLSVYISYIRKALLEEGVDIEYIETIPKYGYRFQIPVSKLADSPITQTVKQRYVESTNSRLRSYYTDKIIITPAKYNRLILTSSVIYALHYTITLYLEIAYKFDVYGTRSLIFSPLFFLGILFTSILGLRKIEQRILDNTGYSLAQGVSIFALASIAAFIGAWFLLPHIRITAAGFQTYTAPAAYLKDIGYIFPIALLYLIVPYHFILSVEQEIKEGRAKAVFELLSGDKESIRPPGTIYIKFWVQGVLITGWLIYAILARAHLFDNLQPSPYLIHFQIFQQTRTMMQFILAFYCMYWYYKNLNRLKIKTKSMLNS